MVLLSAFSKKALPILSLIFAAASLPPGAGAVDLPFTETSLKDCSWFYEHGVICHLEEVTTTGYEEQDELDEYGNVIMEWDSESGTYRRRTVQVPVTSTTQVYVGVDSNKTCRGDTKCWDFPGCPKDPTACQNFMPSATTTARVNDTLGLAMEFLSADFEELARILDQASKPIETRRIQMQRTDPDGKIIPTPPKLNADGTITVQTEPAGQFYLACGTDKSTRNKNQNCYIVTHDFLILAAGNVQKILDSQAKGNADQQSGPPVPPGTQTVQGASAAPGKGEGVSTAVSYCSAPQPDCDKPYKDWYTRPLNEAEMKARRINEASQCVCDAGDTRCVGTPPRCPPEALDLVSPYYGARCGTIYNAAGQPVQPCNAAWWTEVNGRGYTCTSNYLAHWYFRGETNPTYGQGDYLGCPHKHCCKLSTVAAGTGECPFDEFCSEDRVAHGCFDPRTKVRMADGSEKSMLELHVGDAVYNPLLKKGVKIVRVITGPEAKDLVEVGLGGKRVLVSSTHPFYVKGQNGKGPGGAVMRRAVELTEADELLGADGAFHKVETLKSVPAAPNQIVVNVELEGGESNPESHLLLADGVLAGDFTLQALLNR